MPSMTSMHCLSLNLLLLSFVNIMRTGLCVLTWSVHMLILMPCCVCAGSFMEFQCFEVKPENDSKDITGCLHDDKPSTGMLLVLYLCLY